jgi:hypothetical protein
VWKKEQAVVDGPLQKKNVGDVLVGLAIVILAMTRHANGLIFCIGDIFVIGCEASDKGELRAPSSSPLPPRPGSKSFPGIGANK